MKKTVMILAGGLLCSSLATAADSPDLIAQAKKEGSVTFNVWYLQPQWRSFVKDFEQQYGVKVRIPEGNIDGNVNKLLAEAGKKKVK
ncbi:PotD protein [Escherichia coli TA008]|nr:PotD protein [Escherichia coli TA008]